MVPKKINIMKKDFLILSLLSILIINCTHKVANFSTSNYDEILNYEKTSNSQIEIEKSKLDSAIGLCFYKIIEDTTVADRYKNVILKYSGINGKLENYFSTNVNIPDTLVILYSKCIYNIGTFYKKYRFDRCGNLFEINLMCCDAEFIDEKILELYDYYFLTTEKYKFKTNSWNEEILILFNKLNGLN